MSKPPPPAQRAIFDLPDLPSRRSVPYLVQYLARLMTTDFLARVADTGVPPAQSYVLRELWREEPLSQVEISQRLDIGKATVGQSLKRLERDGFVRRSPSPTDGRATVVYLTKKGHEARIPLGTAAREQVEDIDSILTPKRARQLESLLEILVEEHRARLK